MNGQNAKAPTAELPLEVAALISTMLLELIVRSEILSIRSGPGSTSEQREVTLSLPPLAVTRGKLGQAEVTACPNLELKTVPNQPGAVTLVMKDGSNVPLKGLDTVSGMTLRPDSLVIISASVCLSMSSFSNSSPGTR